MRETHFPYVGVTIVVGPPPLLVGRAFPGPPNGKEHRIRLGGSNTGKDITGESLHL